MIFEEPVYVISEVFTIKKKKRKGKNKKFP